MAIRLVTLEDLKNHPEFAGKGISLNMHYDFKEDEETIVLTEEEIIIPTVSQDESVPIETISEEIIKEEIVIPKDDFPLPKVKKAAPKKSTPTKGTKKISKHI